MNVFSSAFGSLNIRAAAAACAAAWALQGALAMAAEPVAIGAAQPVVVPISGPLGLADIVFDLPEDSTPPPGLGVAVTRRDGGELRVPLRPAPTAAHPRRWSARVMAGPPANTDEVPPLRIRMISIDGKGVLSEGPVMTASAEPEPGHATPDWAKGAVWYQIFVERFRNGNPLNDPQPPEYSLAMWSSAWSEVTADELDMARAREAEAPMPRSLPARRRGGQLGNVLSARRYGGDLEGVAEKLDELRDLGVTAIYLNPIFEAHSHHKYDATDFRHIDPTFAGDGRTPEEVEALSRETADPGTWTQTAADRYFLETFAPAVREREMKLVLDGVWNHVGVRHWAFQDVVRNGAGSAYKDWFQCTFATEAEFPDWKDQVLDVQPGRLVSWKSWGGEGRNGGLPEFARDRARGRLFLEVEDHIFACTKRWSGAIDGWRLDVVPDLPMPFWRAWSDVVRSVNPQAALYAEVWFDAKDYYSAAGTAKVFDGQMNYPFAFPAVRWLAGEETMTSEKLAAQLQRVFTHEPQHDLVLMNLFGSHDTERFASMLANPGRDYDQQGSTAANPRYDASRPSSEVYRRVELGVALQTLHLGSPMIYYGDEYGMYGGDDPHCRQPLPWSDLAPYADADVEADHELRRRFRDWLRLRSDPELGPLLRFGAIRYLRSASPDVLVFERTLNGDRVTAVLNRHPTDDLDAAAYRPARPLRRFPEGPLDDATVPSLGAVIWVDHQPVASTAP